MDIKTFVEETQRQLNSIERRLNDFTAIGGQANTASNIGVGGIGLYQQKIGVDLQFRNINAASARISVALDAGNNEVDLDVVEAQINHNSLSGLQGGQADQYYHLTATEHGYVSGANAQSVLKTASPYFVQLGLLDTGADHELYLKCNEDLSADRILSLVTGDAARTITLSGNPTLDDWFDQSVKQAASPTFDDLTISNPVNIYALSHDNFADFVANEHIDWTGASAVFETSSIINVGAQANITSRVGIGGDNLSYTALALRSPGGGITAGPNQRSIQITNVLSGTSDSMVLLISPAIKASTTVTTYVGVAIVQPDMIPGAVVTNNYALKIGNQTRGTTLNYAIYTGTGLVSLGDYLFLRSIKSGATQAAAGAAADELWKTNGHASLPDNVVMIGV